MTPALLIFLGQFAHALLRTSAVRYTAKGHVYTVVWLNVAANLVRLLVMSGGVVAVIGGDWLSVFAFIAGQFLGDLLAMKWKRHAGFD